MSFDALTYALAKSAAYKAIDGVLAGGADLLQYYKKGEVDIKLAEKADKTDIPDKVSAFTNDVGYITISDVYTKDEIDSLVDNNAKIEKVTTLPTTNIKENTLYFLKDENNENKYALYIYSEGKWIKTAGSSEDSGEEGTTYTLVYNVQEHRLELSTDNSATVQWEEIPFFRGATEQDDGLSGLVPSPKKADKEKVLKGDGTWTEVVTKKYVDDAIAAIDLGDLNYASDAEIQQIIDGMDTILNP